MLLYDPPFMFVDGVVVYRDHADPLAYYWLNAVPRLASTGPDDQLSFQATVLLPAASTVGNGDQLVTRTSVSFDTELTLTEELESRVKDEIQRRWQHPPRLLAPVPFTGGTTSFSIGLSIDDNPDIRVHTGHPSSLVADNRAAFSLVASGTEAQLLAAELVSGTPTAVVSYHLEYPGLTPSFNARMSVSWQAVYARFRERDSRSLVFTSEEVESTIEQFEEGREFTFDIQELDPEGASAATKALINELREQITKRLFDPPVQIGEVPIEQRIAHGVRDTLTSLIPGHHHILRTIDQNALSTVEIDIREQRIRTYRMNAQTTLSGLVANIDNLQERIQFIPMEMLPQRLEHIRVELSADAANFAVRRAEIHILASTSGESAPFVDKVVTLDASNLVADFTYRRPDTADPDISYQLTLHLDPLRSPATGEIIIFATRAVIGDRIYIHPESWLDLSTFRFVIDDPTMFEVPTEVELVLAQSNESLARVSAETRLILRADQLEASHTAIVTEGDQANFMVREIFRRQDEPDFVRSLGLITPATYRVMNPFANTWQIRIICSADWTKTRTQIAEFRVWDVERELFLRDETAFNENLTEFTLSISTSPKTTRQAECRLSELDLDGKLTKGPWHDVSGAIATVGASVDAQRRLRFTLIAPQFDQLDLKKVWIEIEWQLLEHDLRFDAHESVRDWLHAFPNPTLERYRYRLRALSRDGERFNGQWTETALDSIRVALPADPF